MRIPSRGARHRIAAEEKSAATHVAQVEGLHQQATSTETSIVALVARRRADEVGQGQTVALAGTTSWSTGCHLHFTIMRNGTAIDPMTVLG